MSWKDLQTASWRGIEFQVQTLRDSLTRRLASHEFPYRNGAQHHDMGRTARPTQITAVFMGTTYESDLSALLQEIDSGLPGTFIHPIFGSWQARLQASSIDHDADSRDMATVSLDVIEEGLDAEVETFFSVEHAIDSLDSATTVFTTLAAALAKIEAYYQKITTAVADVQSKITAVKSAATAAVFAVDRAMNDLRRVVKSTVTLIEEAHPAAVASRLRRQMQVIVYRADQVAASAKLGQPRVIQHEQTVEGPACLVAFENTGDADIADIMRMNRIRNPLKIRAGDKFVAFKKDPDA